MSKLPKIVMPVFPEFLEGANEDFLVDFILSWNEGSR